MCGLKNTREGLGVGVSECRVRVSGWVGVGVMIKVGWWYLETSLHVGHHRSE